MCRVARVLCALFGHAWMVRGMSMRQALRTLPIEDFLGSDPHCRRCDERFVQRRVIPA